MQKITLNAGQKSITLSIDETDHIGRIISTYKQWYELPMLKDAVGRLSDYGPGSIIDVGAHIGNHALYLGARTGRHVYALEPYEPNRRLLIENVEQNDIPITIFPVAAGNSMSTGTIVPPREGNSGTAAIQRNLDIGDVDIVPLDRLDLPAIAMIKIDTEDSATGAVRVTDILQGAQRLLSEFTPLLCIEGNRQTIQRALPLGYQYVATYNRTPTHIFEHINRSA